MNTRGSKVLACIDGSRFSEAVVDYSAWISRAVNCPLKLLNNLESQRAKQVDLSGSIGLGAREQLLEELTQLEEKANRIRMEQGKVMLEQARDRAAEQGALEPAILQRHGTLAESLIEMEEDIRVLVMGVRGEDHQDQNDQIGAQLETVIRTMHRPVFVVNRAFSEPPRQLMLAYDGSEGARKGLELVASSPLYRGMHCHLVRVARDSNSGFDDSQVIRTLEQIGFGVTTAMLHGEVGPALLKYQQEQDIDLTVMGAFGHSRLREFLFGSVTVKMLGGSTVPLLLLR